MIESPSIRYKRIPPYKYELLDPVVILADIQPEAEISHSHFHIGTDGLMTISEGYAWDGASGGIDTKTFMRGSLAHDVVYQAHQLFPDRLPSDWKVKADKMLVRLCKEDGMNPIRAWWVYQAVKFGGHGRPRDLNQYAEILVAP